MKLNLLLHVLMLSAVYCMQQRDIHVENQILVFSNTSLPTFINIGEMGTDIVSVNLLSATSAHGGSVKQDSSGSVIVAYIPLFRYVGQDSFMVTVKNSSGVTSGPITISINVVPLPLRFYLKQVNTLSNVSIKIKLSDLNIGPESLMFNVTVLPSHGKIKGFPCTSQAGFVIFTYKPNRGYVGKDIFQFMVTSASLQISQEATVVINVFDNSLTGSQNPSLHSMIEKYSGM